jgi:hypothetical protein
MRYLTFLLPALAVVRAWSEDMMTKYVDHLDLVADFIPNVPENKLAHHVRTPFAVGALFSSLLSTSADASK